MNKNYAFFGADSISDHCQGGICRTICILLFDLNVNLPVFEI